MRTRGAAINALETGATLSIVDVAEDEVAEDVEVENDKVELGARSATCEDGGSE